MLHKDIEDALLQTGVVDVRSGQMGPIALTTPRGRRLAKVVFSHLRSLNADVLAKSTAFFGELEAAFSEDTDKEGTDKESSEESGEANAFPELRNWRLRKIETRGFGGLNAGCSDVFEFDAAGRDTCIEGQNGSGKSSLANAVLFAMTGKLHRDQYGIWSDPARSEDVVSDNGTKLGEWPPIATYPSSWTIKRPPVDVSVKLTFGNETRTTTKSRRSVECTASLVRSKKRCSSTQDWLRFQRSLRRVY